LQAKKALYAIGLCTTMSLFLKMHLLVLLINKTGSPPEQTLNLCINTDAVLFELSVTQSMTMIQKQSATGARIVEIEKN
jgi:hypothetical protein